jgi:hypothetical protein
MKVRPPPGASEAGELEVKDDNDFNGTAQRGDGAQGL